MNTPETGPIEVAQVLGLGPHRSRWRRLGIAMSWALGAAALVAAALWLLRPKPEPKPSYQTERVQRGPLTVAVTATGTLSAREAVQVGSEITGRVLEVLVDFNDQVTRGQVLARIDTEQYQARMDEARAQLAAADAALKNAEATAREQELGIGRIRALHQAALASKQDLEQAEAAYARSQAAVASARAQRTSAQASLKVSQTSLSKAVIVSPIDGVVLDRTVEPGQTVTSGLQTPVLFTLAADLTELRLDIKVDEADVGQVREGLTATFTVDAYPGREFKSKVLAVKNMPTTEQNVVTYEARLSVDNSERLLRPGMTATASVIVSRKEDALLVPNAALRFTPPETASAESGPSMPLSRLMRGRPPRNRSAARRPGAPGAQPGAGLKGRSGKRSVVWVLDKSKPRRVHVQRGATDGVHTEVTSDKLREGARVIVGLAETEGG